MLGVIFVSWTIEGYEAPTSAKDSLKRILTSTGGWMGGFLIAHLTLNGLQATDQVLSGILGAVTAFVILFAIDLIVLKLRAQRSEAVSDEE
jgi:hypothetical protein